MTVDQQQIKSFREEVMVGTYCRDVQQRTSCRILGLMTAVLATAATAPFGVVAVAQDVKHYRFAYDQPKTTGYGVAGDTFADKLKELSKGQFLVDQYPGAQLGQEPQVLQLLKSGDIDFAITSSANTATVSPQAGVMSLHFLFPS